MLPLLILASFAMPLNALVKGKDSPPKKRPDDSDSKQGCQLKCRNVEECQEMAKMEEILQAQGEAALAASGLKPRIAPGGTNYLEVVKEAGSPPPTAAAAEMAKASNAMDMHYKVLKIGKGSFNGLSGEGTVIFSWGCALEEDKWVPGNQSFQFTIGDDRVIKGESLSSKLIGSWCGCRVHMFFAHQW
jgi:hypothetical protein